MYKFDSVSNPVSVDVRISSKIQEVVYDVKVIRGFSRACFSEKYNLLHFLVVQRMLIGSISYRVHVGRVF